MDLGLSKRAVLLFVANETDRTVRSLGFGNFSAGITSGMVGGLVQAYAIVGFCTCMKMAEITKHKVVEAGGKPAST